jgi:hypothetical protein
MEFSIVFASMIFIGIVGALIYFVFLEPAGKANPKIQNQQSIKPIDDAIQLKKKISNLEEKFKTLELEKEALNQELSLIKEKEKTLLKEKSAITFDTEQYDKFKKDFNQFKDELTKKEEMLEIEITEKRKHASDLIQSKQENEILKKRIIEAEDAERKAQTKIEILTKDIEATSKIIRAQKRIVEEHAENKTEGEWVSRTEFETIERELKEKEIMIQKLLTLKKGT